MPLIDLAAQQPEKFADYSVEQIVSICGDGKLRDGSAASAEFRKFLTLQPPKNLARYANQCLEESFPKSGFVLQDMVNEIGRRLGYKVTNGIYQGKVNQIGFDGLWDDGKTEIIVEVKTTDAYRISLDTLFGYGEKLNANSGAIEKRRQCLIVVGRQDTGELEAQVRGSRYAWTVRLISVDALTRLLFIKEQADDISLVNKIRQILLPIDYTRVDNIVDLVFEAQQEQEDKDTPPEPGETGDEDDKGKESTHAAIPKAELDAKRLQCVAAFFKQHGLSVERKTKTAFADSTGETHVICAVSKRYDSNLRPYWYALHRHRLEFMKERTQGYLILGMMDLDTAYAIPVEQIVPLLPKFNQTVREPEDRSYWHLKISELDGKRYLFLPADGEEFAIGAFEFSTTVL